jgi:hypothetical protein
MVLFLREGMRAWMEAWMKASPRVMTPPPTNPLSPLPMPQGVRDEAILVLASMALRVQREANRW